MARTGLAAHPAGPAPQDPRRRLASQVFSGAGLAAGVTVGALFAEEIVDTTIASGMVMAASSYATLAIAGGLLALAVIPFVAAAAKPLPVGFGAKAR